ncbi:hypothetical protein KIN20_033452 [Parelaphostrongylus tenuis]|uniref:Uncharacterized protein n=1 Tax=Parelaphostrongylus tenuis TaxID=148309 RepID=A0AAD5R820_PARTN|nr:hypothetical protein KIN20_033452 [Parelaphostrongylus tenuis]
MADRCSYPCPMFTNVSDHFMKIFFRDENTSEQDHNLVIKVDEEILKEFEASEEGKHVHYVTHISALTQKRGSETNRKHG